MKKELKKGLTFFLVFSMLMMNASFTSFARISNGDNQDVITGIQSISSDYSVSVSGKTITVTVPYKYTDSVNAQYITPIWDSSIKEAGISWSPYYQTIPVGGSVDGVAYYKVGNDSNIYQSNYKLIVNRAEKVKPYAYGTIKTSTTIGTTIKLSSSDIFSKYQKNEGEGLDHIVITKNPKSSVENEFQVNGIEYYFGSDIPYVDIDSIYYNPGASGTNEYVIQYFESGNNYSVGTVNLSISVENPIIESIDAGKVLKTESAKFPIELLNNKFKTISKSSYDFCKIVFTEFPDSRKGTLKKGYVSSSNTGTSLALNTEYSISYFFNIITFVPGSISGDAVFKYTVYDNNGQGYNGQVIFNVDENKQEIVSQNLRTITYSVKGGHTIDFEISDFTSAINQVSDYPLSYIEITGLPGSSKGVLYFEYEDSSNPGEKVYKNDEYYKSGSKNDLIEDITFVAENTDAIVYVKYIAYDTQLNEYEGEVKIKITESELDSNVEEISYTSVGDSGVKFNSADFISALRKLSDEDLYYVKFELPVNGLGYLYYDYDKNSNDNFLITNTTKCYAEEGSKKVIDNVSFVPIPGYSGIIYIKYIAVDEDDERYEGKVKITVTEGTGGDAESKTMTTINYSLYNDTTLCFSPSDLNMRFKAASSTYDLSYVCFEVPESTYGKLYYNYKNETDKGTEIKDSEKYYYSGTDVKLLSNITFEPSSTYSGELFVKYIAYGNDGNAYSGVIEINVKQASKINTERTSSIYFSDLDQSYSWAIDKIDYLYEREFIKGTISPSGELGFSPYENITRGDFILMIYRAFDLDAVVGTNFLDVPTDSYYYKAIGIAKSLGIAQGAYGNFYPNSSLTREDAMVLLFRALTAVGNKEFVQSKDISKFSDVNDFSDYSITAVGTLVRAGIINGYSEGIFIPKGNLTRAEMAVILYNVDRM